jgi:hypothetical protein
MNKHSAFQSTYSESTYTTQQIADVFGIRRATVILWLKKGLLKAEGSGSSSGYIIKRSSLDQFTAEHPKYRESYRDLIDGDTTDSAAAERLFHRSLLDLMNSEIENTNEEIAACKRKLSYLEDKKASQIQIRMQISSLSKETDKK